MEAFDLSGLAAADTVDLAIKHPGTGEATTWIWTIAGPGHPQTIANADKLQRQALARQRLQEQARINGKKWKGDDRDPDEIRQENAEAIAARVVGFTPVILEAGAEPVRFSPAEVVKLFLDPHFAWLYSQVLEFLGDDASFIAGSAPN